MILNNFRLMSQGGPTLFDGAEANPINDSQLVNYKITTTQLVIYRLRCFNIGIVRCNWILSYVKFFDSDYLLYEFFKLGSIKSIVKQVLRTMLFGMLQKKLT